MSKKLEPVGNENLKSRPGIFVGIDPGKSGAICVMYSKEKIQILDFDEVAKNYFSIMNILYDFQKYFYPGYIQIFIEKVNVMPGQGISSSGNFMENVGIWKGVLRVLKFDYTLIPPKTWQKSIFTADDDIYKSVQERVYPSEFEELKARGIQWEAYKLNSGKNKGKRAYRYEKKVLDRKQMSLIKARQLYPDMIHYLKRAMDHDRAESLLIAEYGRRLYESI